MLIYEPKRYPSLNPKIGDTVYDYLTGEEFGKVTEFFREKFFAYKDKSSYISTLYMSGFYYDLYEQSFSSYDVEQYGAEILLCYSIKANLRIKC